MIEVPIIIYVYTRTRSFGGSHKPQYFKRITFHLNEKNFLDFLKGFVLLKIGNHEVTFERPREKFDKWIDRFEVNKEFVFKINTPYEEKPQEIEQLLVQNGWTKY